jgi:hypothetical protein
VLEGIFGEAAKSETLQSPLRQQDGESHSPVANSHGYGWAPTRPKLNASSPIKALFPHPN